MHHSNARCCAIGLSFHCLSRLWHDSGWSEITCFQGVETTSNKKSRKDIVKDRTRESCVQTCAWVSCQIICLTYFHNAREIICLRLKGHMLLTKGSYAHNKGSYAHNWKVICLRKVICLWPKGHVLTTERSCPYDRKVMCPRLKGHVSLNGRSYWCLQLKDHTSHLFPWFECHLRPRKSGFACLLWRVPACPARSSISRISMIRQMSANYVFEPERIMKMLFSCEQGVLSSLTHRKCVDSLSNIVLHVVVVIVFSLQPSARDLW